MLLVVYSSACAIFITILSLVAELSPLELVNFTKSLLSRALLLHFCKYCSEIYTMFLAHLSTTCSRGAFRVVRCLLCVVSSTISLNSFFSQTAGPIWTKLGSNVLWEVLFKNCSQNLIPFKTLVAMATKLNFLSNSLKISSSGTTGLILKFHRNLP